MFSKIKVVSLDLDDTLWDINVVMKRAETVLQDWLRENYPRIDETYTKQDIRQLRIQMNDKYPQHAYDLKEMRLLTLRYLAEQVGYPETLADEAFEVFFAARNRVDLFADVEPALRLLSKYYEIVALTNGNADLSVIGLDKYFSANITARDVGVGKPDPEMFSAILAHTNCKVEEIVHVGDHAELDVHAAREVGMTAVWMNRFELEWPKGISHAEHQVSCMRELCELLGKK